LSLSTQLETVWWPPRSRAGVLSIVPQGPKEVTRDTACSLSSVIGVLAIFGGLSLLVR
jgi:hypothetical protein